jgi:hypothetical protein
MGRHPEHERQMSPEEYANVTAIVMHSQLKLAATIRFPALSIVEHDRLVLNVIDRLARLRGYRIAVDY